MPPGLPPFNACFVGRLRWLMFSPLRVFEIFVCCILCAVCSKQSSYLVSALVLPRVMWDAWPLPQNSSASVGWGKGAARGQQFTIPRHNKIDPQPVFLPIGSQLMENGAILAMGYNHCKGPQKFDAFNTNERETSMAAHGNMAAVGGGWASKDCAFHLTQFDTKTGKLLHTFEYTTVQDADPVVVGFYAHDSIDKHSTKMNNALVMFVWQQQVTHRQKICIADKTTRFYFNGLTTDTVKALQRGRAYRSLFKEKDETVLRDPYGTAAHVPPLGIRLCDAFYTDKVKPEAGDLRKSFSNADPELAPTFADCGTNIKTEKNTLPPGKDRNCLNVPLDKNEPLGLLWGRALKLDPSKPGSYPYKEWREAFTTVYPVKKIPVLRSNFKNAVAIYEGNFSRPKHYSYFLLHYNYLSSPEGPPSRACFAAAMSHELRLQYIYLGCRQCGEFGLLPWKPSTSLDKAEKLFGLLVWCVEEGFEMGNKGTLARAPSLIVNGSTNERRVVLSDLLSDAGYPPSAINSGSYFHPLVRNVHVIPTRDSTLAYYFYVVEKYMPLNDFRFGPVAAAEARWGMFDVGDNKAALSPIVKPPIFAEVYSPELHAFSVVPVGENLLMLAYENTIQQNFNVLLFDPQKEQTIEGADLLLPDSQSEAYNSFAYGTQVLFSSTGDADGSKSRSEGLKLQFGRPGSADTVNGFAAPRTIAANSFSSSDMFRIKFAAKDVYCEGKWKPALQFAPCTFYCNKVQTFLTPADASSSAQCPWKNNQHRVIPCEEPPCNFVQFDVENEPELAGSVDGDIKTAGGSFAPGSLSPVTIKLKTISDIWEVTLFFKGTPERNDFLVELFFLDGQGQEFTKRDVRAGGEFSVIFPYRRAWKHFQEATGGSTAEGEQEGHVGFVVRAASMELYGVHSIGIVYHGKDNAAELLEILVKGRPEPAVCPPHGFFTNPTVCPPSDELLIPEKLEDLDCQGTWSEWSVCDYFCRQIRFFEKSRDPLLGGTPCPTLQHKTCDEGPFCRAGEIRYSALLDNFKRRDCQYEVGDWSDCVNCRQLRYLHILTAAAKDGVSCPAKPAIQTRFCDRICEKIFAEGSSPKPQPSSSSSSTSSSTKSSSSSISSANGSSTSTPKPQDNAAMEQLRWNLVIAIIGGNVLLLFVVCLSGLCLLRERYHAFHRVLDGRKKLIALKQVSHAQRRREGDKKAAANGITKEAAKEPATAKMSAPPRSLSPGAVHNAGNDVEKDTEQHSTAPAAGVNVMIVPFSPDTQSSSLLNGCRRERQEKQPRPTINSRSSDRQEGRKRKGERPRCELGNTPSETPTHPEQVPPV